MNFKDTLTKCTKYGTPHERLLVGLLIIINIMGIALSANYLNFGNMTSSLGLFFDRAFMVFPMALIMLMGDIDISVASILALASVIMGVSVEAGAPLWLGILLCVGVGTLCGFINGLIISKFPELSAAIVTISTMIFYRGIAYIILENRAATGFPEGFSNLAWGTVFSIPLVIPLFLLCAVIFSLFLHRTPTGRTIVGVGANKEALRYSGIDVPKIKLMVFTLMGFMCGLAALFHTSRLMSTRPNMSTGYELEIIAMVVLGGVSTAGGSGRMGGVILAAFSVALLKYGLGLVNVHTQILTIIIGFLLIGASLAPILTAKFQGAFGKKRAKSKVSTA